MSTETQAAQTPITADDLEVAEATYRTRKRNLLSGDNIFGGFSQILLIIWALMVILPFAWMIMTAFKTDPEIIFDPWAIPESLQWNNFERAWEEAKIGTYFKNTIFVVSFSVFFTLLFSSMTAYVLARFEFPGNRWIYYMFMAGLMFPVFLALVPLFFLVQDINDWFNLTNNLPALILVYIAYSLPFSVFFLTSFFKSLPSELAEAAVVDGASHYRVFFGVMLPLARPGLLAIGIFNVLGQWNQFILPLVLNPNPDTYLLTQGLAFLAIQQGYQNDYSALFAALVITMIPILVVYVLFQRKLEAGLTAGALKG
ncbi:MAG: carbohydrate ABC transporter permease [Thermomicrobiales bacterium]